MHQLLFFTPPPITVESLAPSALAAQRRAAADRLAVQQAWINSVTGETWTVQHASTEYWEMYEEMQPDAFVNTAHIHPQQDELIVVLQGRVSLLYHNQWIELRAGQQCNVPRGVSHALVNRSADKVLMRVRYTPGLPHMSEYFRSLASLSRLGYMSRTGIPHPLFCALLFRLEPELVQFWWFPPLLMRCYALLVSPIAEWCGYSLHWLDKNAQQTKQK